MTPKDFQSWELKTRLTTTVHSSTWVREHHVHYSHVAAEKVHDQRKKKKKHLAFTFLTMGTQVVTDATNKEGFS